MHVSPNSSSPSFDALYLERDHSLWRIRLGEKTINFSDVEMAEADFDVKTGMVHLKSEDGQTLKSVRVPDLRALQFEAEKLRLEGIVIKKEEISDFLKWMASQTLNRQDIKLILQELDRMVPEIKPPHQPATSAIQEIQLARVLDLMPEEIVQMVLTYSVENSEGKLEDLKNLLERIDLNRNPDICAFLEGRHANLSKIEHLLSDLVQRDRLLVFQSPRILAPQALETIINWIADKEIKPVEGGLVPVKLMENLNQAGLLQVPDFTLFDSLDEMESEWHLQLQKNLQKSPRLKITHFLIQYMSKKDFPFLNDFLTNRKTAWEVQHEGELETLLSGVNRTRERTPLDPLIPAKVHQLTKRVPEQLIDYPASKNNPIDTRFFKLNPFQKMAFWVLDHASPKLTPQLQAFFQNQVPTSCFTSSIKREITQLTNHLDLGPSRPDLTSPGTHHQFMERFSILENWLESSGYGNKSHSYYPRSAVVEDLMDHFFLPPQPSQPRAAVSKLWIESMHQKMPTKLSVAIDTLLQANLTDDKKNDLLASVLRRKFRNFKSLKLLNSILQTEAALTRMTKTPVETNETGSHLPSDTNRGRIPIQNLLKSLHGEGAPQKWLLHTLEKPLGESLFKALKIQEPYNSFSPGRMYEAVSTQLREWPANFSEKIQLLSWARALSQSTDLPPNQSQTTLRAQINDLIKFMCQTKEIKWNQLPLHADNPLFHDPDQKGLESITKTMTSLLDGDHDGVLPEHAKRELRDLLSRLDQKQANLDRPEKWLQQLFQTVESHETIQHLPEKMARFLDRLHEWNRFQNMNQAPLFFSIPISMGHEQRHLEVLFKPLSTRKKKDRFLVVLHLDFDKWGHFRADVLKEDTAYKATFWAGNKNMQNRLNMKMSELKDQLKNAGWVNISLDVRLSEDRAQKKPSELIEAYHDGSLNLKA